METDEEISCPSCAEEFDPEIGPDEVLPEERKDAVLNDPCEIALWSAKIGFTHPGTGEWVEFAKEPPAVFPWTVV